MVAIQSALIRADINYRIGAQVIGALAEIQGHVGCVRLGDIIHGVENAVPGAGDAAGTIGRFGNVHIIRLGMCDLAEEEGHYCREE